MDILAIEDMKHVDALQFSSVQIWELAKQDSQLEALKVTILGGWPGNKDETPHMYQRILLSSEETVSSLQKYCHQKC